MLVRKVNPVGVDAKIDVFQAFIYSRLESVFPGWESNHRAYRNPKSMDGRTEMIPEVFVSEGEYKEVFTDDTIPMLSFFYVADQRAVTDGSYRASVSLIVMSNLTSCLPDVPHRADEELIAEFVDAINLSKWQKYLSQIRTGIDSVFQEFGRSQITYNDMSRFHVVRFDFNEVPYDPSKECCTDC